MSKKPLLTIIVPTYNRSANLAILLKTLREEITSVDNDVIVTVYDNCSSDNTPNIIDNATVNWPGFTSYRHSMNIGPDRNFCHAVDAVKTRWFWIIGDDDLPKRGMLAKIVNLLHVKKPALLYMRSEWMNPVLNPDQGIPLGDLQITQLSNHKFAEEVHVWVTFTSGMVIDKERLHDVLGDHNINRYVDTNLVQLGWVLPLFKSDGPFLFISNSCILATKDNSGGYGLLTVFGVNFTRIVNETFGIDNSLARVLIGGNIRQYLPGLIWGSRNKRQRTSHTPERPWNLLNEQLGAHWLYWLLLVPIGRLPRILAQPFFQTWRVLNRLRREWNQRFGSKMKHTI